MKNSALVLLSALLVSGFATATEETAASAGGSTASTAAVGTATTTAVAVKTARHLDDILIGFGT